ncbi:FmdB family zinc ribbon protein [Magnetococcus sp. PR-3]|uniref:FmdB family zinc ribbon protein n=1 Tax=Magnetococcus sp. PR-3 TaxID=3120355 RepID=UPI003FA5FE5C
MPLYDYKCDSCDHTFEVQHSMSETPKLACPKCEAKEIRKILSTGGIVGSTKMGQDSAPPSPCAGGACGMGGGCPIA